MGIKKHIRDLHTQVAINAAADTMIELAFWGNGRAHRKPIFSLLTLDICPITEIDLATGKYRMNDVDIACLGIVRAFRVAIELYFRECSCYFFPLVGILNTVEVS